MGTILGSIALTPRWDMLQRIGREATMSDSNDCPSSDELRGLSDGTLDDATRRRLTLHLEKCERCRAALANQSLSDELAFADPDPVLGLTASSGITDAPGATETQQNDPEDEPLEKSALPPEIDMQTCRLGKYEILGIIGHGGMGIVLRGFDSSLHRPVAIKVLNKHLASSPTARRRFQREARAAAAVSHPHVVTIHAVEEQNGLPYLIMEFIDGGSLEERIRSQKHFTVKEILRLGSQIAAGLAAAHAQGVIHRDIKPSNIMWEDSIGRVKITDFGLARVTMDNSELTSGGRAVGTPSYMAPEQVRGQTVDPRADLFSLGCLLYAMVAGRSPFRASHSFESARKVIDYKPRPLTEIDPRVPKFLSDVVARLLEKEPAARYQTAGEVADILTRHLAAANQAQSDQLDTTLAGFAAVPTQRRRWLPWAAAVAGLLLLAAATLPYALSKFGGPNGDPILAGSAQLPKQQAVPQTLLVSQVPGQGLTTIGAALAKANPGDIIRVLDDAEYREALQIAGPRHRGLRLEAPQAARLVAPDPRQSALDIDSAENVTISGLRIAAPQEGHAVFLHGPCRGVVLDNVECRHDSAAGAAATVQIYVTGEAASTAPLTIRNSRIASLGRGQCVWVSGSAETAPRIELHRNRFECAGSHVVFQTAARQIDIRGNAFVGGTNGVNLDLREELPDEQICIANNTFLHTKFWIGLLAARTEQPIGTICNNLVLGSERVQGKPDDWQQVAAAWSVHHNLWEVDAEQLGDYRAIAEKLADLTPAVELVSRDSNAAGFLRPPPDSVLLRGGAGAVWPAHIGAFLGKQDSESKENQ